VFYYPSFSQNCHPFVFILTDNIDTDNDEWFRNIPASVHKCFYNSAIEDSETFAAFARCQQTNGGEKCIREIPAGLNCLNQGAKRRAVPTTSSAGLTLKGSAGIRKIDGNSNIENINGTFYDCI